MARKVHIKLDQVGASCFIKDLLSCPKEWFYKTTYDNLTIDMSEVDSQQLKREIRDWLNVPVQGHCLYMRPLRKASPY